MASGTRVVRFLARVASRSSGVGPKSLSRALESSTYAQSALSRSSFLSAAANPFPSSSGEIRNCQRLSSSGYPFEPRAESAVVPFWLRDFSSQFGGLGKQKAAQSATGRFSSGTQLKRTIMVEVKRNDLDRAIRRWRRKCKEENLISLKDREYFRKPSEKRVLALKERDRRIAKRAFKVKLNWIMSRQQRGF